MSISYIVEIITGIFAFIMGIIPMIVILIVISRIVKVSKNQASRGNTQGDPNAWLQRQQSRQASKRLVKSLKTNSSGEYNTDGRQFMFGKGSAGRSSGSLLKAEGSSSLSETFMKDDRKNDWLARQMREEEKILRRGDLLDLGASHAASCDADMLKKYHLFAEHDDSVDNGEY